MIERRRFVRIPESSQIYYEVLPHDMVRGNISRDISKGGIRFLVQQFIPKGSTLKIRLTLEKTSFSFEALVKVMWVRQVPHSEGYEVGVEFSDIPGSASDHLMKYIQASLDTDPPQSPGDSK